MTADFESACRAMARYVSTYTEYPQRFDEDERYFMREVDGFKEILESEASMPAGVSPDTAAALQDVRDALNMARAAKEIAAAAAGLAERQANAFQQDRVRLSEEYARNEAVYEQDVQMVTERIALLEEDMQESFRRRDYKSLYLFGRDISFHRQQLDIMAAAFHERRA